MHHNGASTVPRAQTDLAIASIPAVLARSRPLFLSVCCYVASQVFTVPIAATGPSWAIWPTLSDIAVVFILMARLATLRHTISPSPWNASALRSFFVVFMVCLVSYVGQTILLGGSGDSKAGIFGGYSIYRLAEFLVVLWGAAALPITLLRRRVLFVISLLAFVMVCAGIAATYFSVVSPADFVHQLPEDRSAGAWGNYRSAVGDGMGTIGYNHGYVAAQVLMLLALALHLADSFGMGTISAAALLFLGTFTCFLTGSRMGLISMLLFWGILLLRVPVKFRMPVTALALVVITLIGLALTWGGGSGDSGDVDGDLYSRQKTILAAFQHDSLSGRDEIWRDRLDYLNRDWSRWVLGGGLGSAADMGGDAHMQLLEIVSELGLVGVLVWTVWFVRTIRALWLREDNSHAIFWVSVCLIASCVSQETLYPVAAMGHFLGLYLVAVAIALRQDELIPTTSAAGTY